MAAGLTPLVRQAGQESWLAVGGFNIKRESFTVKNPKVSLEG